MTTATSTISVVVVKRIAEVQKLHLWSHTVTTHCSCGWKAEGLVNVLEQWTEHVAEEVSSAISDLLLTSLEPAVDALYSDRMELHQFIHHVRNEVRKERTGALEVQAF